MRSRAGNRTGWKESYYKQGSAAALRLTPADKNEIAKYLASFGTVAVPVPTGEPTRRVDGTAPNASKQASDFDEDLDMEGSPESVDAEVRERLQHVQYLIRVSLLTPRQPASQKLPRKRSGHTIRIALTRPTKRPKNTSNEDEHDDVGDFRKGFDTTPMSPQSAAIQNPVVEGIEGSIRATRTGTGHRGYLGGTSACEYFGVAAAGRHGRNLRRESCQSRRSSHGKCMHEWP